MSIRLLIHVNLFNKMFMYTVVVKKIVKDKLLMLDLNKFYLRITDL